MPNSAESHNNLGIALGRKGRLADAIGEFQQALKIDPNHGEARHNLDAALQAARAGAPTR
jgi:Flp pilus assembly protein TadD